jgi:hypothetical protein
MEQPLDLRWPNRPPDGYAIIDKDCRILGGDNLPLPLHQVIYDCLASYEDYKVFKRAILSSREDAPSGARVQIHHHLGCHPTLLIRVDPLHRSHLIGAWEAPASIFNFSTSSQQFH